MTTHKVRSWKHLFAPMLAGVKTHDLRKNDRDYKVGDEMLMQEYEPATGLYTGREQLVQITYITGNGKHQNPCAVSSAVLQDGYVILSIRHCK
jgi:Domain of unknown function (DUF3850)